jgi:hypothetical protein
VDITHKRGGNMEICLGSEDIAMMEIQGFCMKRQGLVGPETKTWVRKDALQNHPIAKLDRASDVYVHLPNGAADLPASIVQSDIDPYMDSDRSRVEWHFGAAGAIIVKLSE